VSTSMKRQSVKKVISRRRVVNVQSLQMMVRSGVVRRADALPPLPLSRTRIQVSEDHQAAVSDDAVSQQGWLSRIILGRKAHSVLVKRS
jgi:hypothetical protein